MRDPSFFACCCILPTLLSLSGRTQSLFQTTTVGGKRSDCAGSETVADSGTDQKGKGPFSDCASYCYTHGSICGLCAKAPPISPTGFPLKPPLNLEVMLDEFYTVLLRIKLFCHIIAVCLVALTLIEGTRALSCIVDSVQRWAAFAYHALARGCTTLAKNNTVCLLHIALAHEGSH